MPRLAACLALGLTVLPAFAESPNLSARPIGNPGDTARLVLAQKTYAEAMERGDMIALLVAIRLAREIVKRPPTAWEKTTTGAAPPDEAAGRDAPDDPGSDATLAIAQGFAGDDPDLQDLVYDLDAQLPTHARLDTVVMAASDLGSGQTDSWRMPLSGEVPAEIGLIGDGDSPLGLTVTDAGGAVVCAVPFGLQPALCHFTPARNGFFVVEVHNPGGGRNSYRLIAN
jgi:hypothetical protein